MLTKNRFVWIENKSIHFVKFSISYTDSPEKIIQETDPIPFYASKKLYIPDDNKSVDITVYFLENGLEWKQIFSKTFKKQGDIGLDVLGPKSEPPYKDKEL